MKLRYLVNPLNWNHIGWSNVARWVQAIALVVIAVKL